MPVIKGVADIVDGCLGVSHASMSRNWTAWTDMTTASLTISKELPHPSLVPPPKEADAGHEDDCGYGAWYPVP
jgi:hypothetical protein